MTRRDVMELPVLAAVLFAADLDHGRFQIAARGGIFDTASLIERGSPFGRY